MEGCAGCWSGWVLFQLLLERCVYEKGGCVRGECGGGGGGGGGGLFVAVCLGVIYQFYCFLVLLLAAISPHLAPLFPVHLAIRSHTSI